MSQCPAQAEDKTGLWRCLADEGHVGEHRFDAEYYRLRIADLEAENARLQAQIHRALIHLETSAASVGAARAKLEEDSSHGGDTTGMEAGS